jgi:hypothetical protein
MRIKSPVLYLLAAALLLVPVTAALAEPDLITVTVTSPQTTYTAGQNNTFTFNVGLVFSGAEYVDRYQFTFPAGITVVSATPASGTGACGADVGLQSICSPSVSWGAVGVPCSGAFTPSGCGAYNDATVAFDVTVSIPGGFTGPLDMTLTSIGDGFLLPAGTVDVDTVTFTQLQTCTLTLTCPADQNAAAPPGTTGTTVNFPLPSLGGTCTGVTTDCVPAPGDFFPVGTTAVTCTATVAGVPPPTCAFNVTVGNQTVQEIPTASTWGLAGLVLLLAGAAFVALRRSA